MLSNKKPAMLAGSLMSLVALEQDPGADGALDLLEAGQGIVTTFGFHIDDHIAVSAVVCRYWAAMLNPSLAKAWLIWLSTPGWLR